VVTVGSFHAGTKRNVIPEEAHLQLTVRSYSDEDRTELVDGVRQLARATCEAFQCPKPPVVELKPNYTPAVYNDPDFSESAGALFRNVLGEEAVERGTPTMGGEDFSRYARTLKVPGLLFRLGTVSPAAMKRSRRKGSPPLPSLHSSKFAPDAEQALATGLRAMADLALAILHKP
jgi:hippurate hydrolase